MIDSERLITEARGAIHSTLLSRVRLIPSKSEQDQVVEELTGQTIVEILDRLESGGVIHHPRAYAAVTARNCWNDLAREENPEWHRLADQVRYFFRQRTEQFAFWGRSGARLCGRAGWKGQAETENAWHRLTDRHAVWVSQTFPAGDERDAKKLPILIARLLDRVGGPVSLPDLINAIALILGLRIRPGYVNLDEPIPEEEEESGGRHQGEIRGSSAGGLDESRLTALAAHPYLRQLWKEICRLERMPRRVILCKVGEKPKEGKKQEQPFDPLFDWFVEFLIEYLIDQKIVTKQELAMALALLEANLDLFLQQLPMDDLELAQFVEIPVSPRHPDPEKYLRSEVAQIRFRARERLRRRMRRYRLEV